MGQKNAADFASLWAPQCTWVSSEDEQNPFAVWKKSWPLPSTYWGVGWGLFLICVCRDLRVNLGGRKDLCTAQSFLLLRGSLLCSRFSPAFPSLPWNAFPAVLLFLSSKARMSHLLAAEWNLLHSCFPSQFKNMIVVHLLVQPKLSKKKRPQERELRKADICLQQSKKIPEGPKSKELRFEGKIVSAGRNKCGIKKPCQTDF